MNPAVECKGRAVTSPWWMNTAWTFSQRREGVHPLFWHLQIINLLLWVVKPVIKLVVFAQLNYLVFHLTWIWEFPQFMERISSKFNVLYSWIQSNLQQPIPPNQYVSILQTQRFFLLKLFNVYVCSIALNKCEVQIHSYTCHMLYELSCY